MEISAHFLSFHASVTRGSSLSVEQSLATLPDLGFFLLVGFSIVVVSGGNGSGGACRGLFIIIRDDLRAVFRFILRQDFVQVVAPAEVDEETANVGLQLVADHFRNGLEVLAVLANTCHRCRCHRN